MRFASWAPVQTGSFEVCEPLVVDVLPEACGTAEDAELEPDASLPDRGTSCLYPYLSKATVKNEWLVYV